MIHVNTNIIKMVQLKNDPPPNQSILDLLEKLPMSGELSCDTYGLGGVIRLRRIL